MRKFIASDAVRTRVAGATAMVFTSILVIAIGVAPSSWASSEPVRPASAVRTGCGTAKHLLAGPDEALWVQGGAMRHVCRVRGTTSEAVRFPPTRGQASSHSLVRGPDGRPWFDYSTRGQIGKTNATVEGGVARVNPDLGVTAFPIAQAELARGLFTGGLYPGPGGSLELYAAVIDTAKATLYPRILAQVAFTVSVSGLSGPHPYADPFGVSRARRLVTYAPDGALWAAFPSNRRIVRAAFGARPRKTLGAPAGLSQATWFAAGADERLWFGTNRVATSWRVGTRAFTVRLPQHTTLRPGPAAVLRSGHLVIAFTRATREKTRETVFMLSTDGARRELDVRAESPTSMLAGDTGLWIGTNRHIFRYRIGRAATSASEPSRGSRDPALTTRSKPQGGEWDPGGPTLEPSDGDDGPSGEDDEEAYAERHCAPERDGEQCGPGYGRQTEGGGDKVSHAGWPSVTGILWKVLTGDGRRKIGGKRNDELLGHHGSDRIAGAGGNDIIWGDWDPKDNNTRQRDVLRGGSGNDWIYSSHGENRIYGGGGRDYVWAYYGRGTIDCGPGKHDTARIRLDSGYRVKNCERIKNFCAHGSKPGNKGGCYKPGEKPAPRARIR